MSDITRKEQVEREEVIKGQFGGRIDQIWWLTGYGEEEEKGRRRRKTNPRYT